jgi:hypothetical protein
MPDDTNTYERELPVKMTAKERAKEAQDLARLELELADYRDETRDLANHRRRRTKELEGAIIESATAVKDGTKPGMVACTDQYSEDGFTVTVIRLDTMDEVESRVLSKEEHAQTHNATLDLGGCVHEAPPDATNEDAFACVHCGVQITRGYTVPSESDAA